MLRDDHTTHTGTVELLNRSKVRARYWHRAAVCSHWRLRAEVSPNWLYIGTVITTLDDNGKVVGLEGAVHDIDSMDLVAGVTSLY